jgi:hypothetical protein
LYYGIFHLGQIFKFSLGLSVGRYFGMGRGVFSRCDMGMKELEVTRVVLEHEFLIRRCFDSKCLKSIEDTLEFTN